MCARTLLDHGVDGSTLYLVMELVEGIDLRRLAGRGEMRGEPIPPALAGYVMHQVLWALEAALELERATAAVLELEAHLRAHYLDGYGFDGAGKTTADICGKGRVEAAIRIQQGDPGAKAAGIRS